MPTSQTPPPPSPPRPGSGGPNAAAPEPITSGSDLFQLFGRFMATMVIFFLAVAQMVMGRRDLALFYFFLSLVLQIWTIRLWRRLRDERQAKLAARAAEATEAAARAAASPEKEPTAP